MSFYLKSGKTFRVTSKEALDLHEKLPAGNYVIKQDSQENLYLEGIDDFAFKGKRYGNHERDCNRIFSTFSSRDNSTGVMLAGEKGSGKSLLAKLICMKGAKEGVPSIIVNAAWCGDKFNSFMQTIEQPAIVFFDEFEKVYGTEEQEQILTLLDGVFPSKKLFLITCNDKWRVDSHMRNRPGRIYYMIDFKGLDQQFIAEYCQDNLANKEHITRIGQIASLFSQFNFDMLKALVEEMNRYNESPETALQMLNVKPEFDQYKDTEYAIKVSRAGVPMDESWVYTKKWKGNPLQQQIEVMIKVMRKSVDKEEPDYEDSDYIYFSANHIKKIDAATLTYVLVNDNQDSLVLTRVEANSFNAYGAF
jgi:SpoVK/Ycf46/Vps4 family AAA+-type ATPase